MAQKGTTLQAIRVWDIRAGFDLNDASEYVIISNVLFISELSHNLISLAKLCNHYIQLFVDVNGIYYLMQKIKPFGVRS